jgi:hypothetical protein
VKRVLLPALLLAALALACGGNGEQPTVSVPPAPSPEASPSPTATAVPLPAMPSSFGEIPAAIADYLTQADGSSDCLAKLFAAWDMPSDGTTQCAAADMDGDGEDEYVVRVAQSAEAATSPEGVAGTVIVFDDEAGAYVGVFRLEDLTDASGQPVFPAEGRIPDPAIFGVDDYNGDGRAEAALTSSECGASTCSLTLCLVASTDGAYANVIQSSEGGGCVSAPVADNQVRFEDVDGDGVSELLFREGLIGSVGAGPQRESVRTYRWDGEHYVLDSTEYAPSDLRYFKVRDADDAFTRGDYQTAISLYQEAAESSSLKEVDGFGDPAELKAYARFRIGLVKAVQGDEAGALAAVDAAIAADPNALHSQMAAQFRLGYKKVKHVSAGCSAARDFVQGHLNAFTALWDYGYANPTFQPAALCPS